MNLLVVVGSDGVSGTLDGGLFVLGLDVGGGLVVVGLDVLLGLAGVGLDKVGGDGLLDGGGDILAAVLFTVRGAIAEIRDVVTYGQTLLIE